METVRTVRNCPLRFQAECPKVWENLMGTSDPAKRHCVRCERDVFLCSGLDDTIAHGRVGHLVARDEPAQAELPPLRLDGPPFHPSASQLQAQDLHRREHGITILLNGRLEGALLAHTALTTVAAATR